MAAFAVQMPAAMCRPVAVQRASQRAGAVVGAQRAVLGGQRVSLAAPAPRAVRLARFAAKASAAEEVAAAGEEEEAPRKRGARTGGGAPRGGAGRGKPVSEFEERVVEVKRVTKVVKGGKQLSFRAVVIIGNRKGLVGVGVAKAKEVVIAVQKAVSDAKKNLSTVPITSVASVPHRAWLKGDGAASIVVRPAKEGSGITAGGSVRTVLELAGYKNVNAKMVGGTNPLSNGRAIVSALTSMRTPEQVAEDRSLTTEEMYARMASARLSKVGA